MSVEIAQVRDIFKNLETGDENRFFTFVADDVDWTVEGTHPLAGHYHTKADFLAHTFEKLAKVLRVARNFTLRMCWRAGAGR